MGIDPKVALPTAEDYQRAAQSQDYKDPVLKCLEDLSEENVIAFRLAKAQLDTVTNIAKCWTYNMVREALDYLEIEQEYQDREQRRMEAQTK